MSNKVEIYIVFFLNLFALVLQSSHNKIVIVSRLTPLNPHPPPKGPLAKKKRKTKSPPLTNKMFLLVESPFGGGGNVGRKKGWLLLSASVKSFLVSRMRDFYGTN